MCYSEIVRDDIIELTDCPRPELLKVIGNRHGIITYSPLASYGEKTYQAELHKSFITLIKHSFVCDKQLRFPFMCGEDVNLAGYIANRLQKERERWLEINPTGPQYKPTKMEKNIESKIAGTLAKMSLEQIRELFS